MENAVSVFQWIATAVFTGEPGKERLGSEFELPDVSWVQEVNGLCTFPHSSRSTFDDLILPFML